MGHRISPELEQAMSEYQPGLENRGTCPYCERRVGVYVPKLGDGSARVCVSHRPPSRHQAFWGGGKCHGSGMICLEDRR